MAFSVEGFRLGVVFRSGLVCVCFGLGWLGILFVCWTCVCCSVGLLFAFVLLCFGFVLCWVVVDFTFVRYDFRNSGKFLLKWFSLLLMVYGVYW